MSAERAELELAGLERAAEVAGFPGLTARVVPPAARRARWFVVQGGELLVNERVLERLRPDEGGALCTTELLRLRMLRPWRVGLPLAGLVVMGSGFGVGSALVAGGLTGWGSAAALGAWGALAGLLVWLLVAPALYGLASQRADERAIVVVGDPDTVVRSMNLMNQDRLEVGGKRLDARPDIHARAERIVDRYELRLPYEQRSEAARARPGARDSAGSCLATCETAHAHADEAPGLIEAALADRRAGRD